MNGVLFAGLMFIAAMGPQPDMSISQEITPTATVTATVVAEDWSFPTEPLLPLQYEAPADIIDAPITPGNLWQIARVALTSYNIVSGGNAATWLLFAVILLLPLGGLILYRVLTDPPEI